MDVERPLKRTLQLFFQTRGTKQSSAPYLSSFTLARLLPPSPDTATGSGVAATLTEGEGVEAADPLAGANTVAAVTGAAAKFPDVLVSPASSAIGTCFKLAREKEGVLEAGGVGTSDAALTTDGCSEGGSVSGLGKRQKPAIPIEALSLWRFRRVGNGRGDGRSLVELLRHRVNHLRDALAKVGRVLRVGKVEAPHGAARSPLHKVGRDHGARAAGAQRAVDHVLQAAT
jgi:hypothetical protein